MELFSYVRLCAHLMLIGWTVAMIFAAILARGQTVTITHVPIAASGLALAGLWFMGLAFTVKGSEILPRATIVPLLAVLELGTGVCAWGWLTLCGRFNFRFQMRRRPSPLAVIILVLMTILLAGCTVDAHVVITQPMATPTQRPVIAAFVTPTPTQPVSPLAAPESPLAIPLALTPDVRPYTTEVPLPMPGTTSGVIGNTQGD